MASGRNHDRAITVTTPILMAAAIVSGHAETGLIATALQGCTSLPIWI